jgi:hypothetical protein
MKDHLLTEVVSLSSSEKSGLGAIVIEVKLGIDCWTGTDIRVSSCFFNLRNSLQTVIVQDHLGCPHKIRKCIHMQCYNICKSIKLTSYSAHRNEGAES